MPDKNRRYMQTGQRGQVSSVSCASCAMRSKHLSSSSLSCAGKAQDKDPLTSRQSSHAPWRRRTAGNFVRDSAPGDENPCLNRWNTSLSQRPRIRLSPQRCSSRQASSANSLPVSHCKEAPGNFRARVIITIRDAGTEARENAKPKEA